MNNEFNPGEKTTLPSGSAERKEIPMYEGLLKYFPRALAEVAHISKLGNDKHNPGEPLHHARGKSTDHADCIIRHLIDLLENYGKGVGRDEQGIPQVGYIAWRALALAQEWFEHNEAAPRAPGAWVQGDVLKALEASHHSEDVQKYSGHTVRYATLDDLKSSLPVHEIPCHWCGAVGDEEHSCGGRS